MLDMSSQSRRHPLSERGFDCYETPACAVEALLRAEQLPLRIWEPACGRGRIVDVLRAHGHEVVATDLIDYGLPFTPPGYYGRNFLRETSLPAGTGAILTNPPFMIVEKFVAHALELAPPMVVMLLRLAFLESERRCSILENAGLARLHVFRKRLPMLHRDGWTGRKANSGMAFMWGIWVRGYTGLPTVNRISWER
jgi:hypothetical protein